MREELDKALCENYPKIFKDRHKSMRETCMCWGFCCGDGWYDLIDRMCRTLQFYATKNGYPQVIADQVKEKWGELRFYYHFEEPENDESDTYFHHKAGFIDGVVTFATSMSSEICEDCGKVHKNGIRAIPCWYRSLCDECTTKRESK